MAGDLSQEEIDKLLRGEKVEEKEEEKEIGEFEKTQIDMLKEDKKTVTLDKEEMDVMGELANISFGSAATTLSEILGKEIKISYPTLEVVTNSLMEEDIPHVVLSVEYKRALQLENLLVVKASVAKIIASLMMGQGGEIDEEQINELEMSAVQEALNQMMGTAATAMSELVNEPVDITPPKINLVNVEEEARKMDDSSSFLKVSFDFEIVGLAKTKLIQLITIPKAKYVAGKLLKNESQVNATDFDVLAEMANISFGTASTTLSNIINMPVSIDSPKVSVVDKKEEKDKKSVILNVSFRKGLHYENLLVFKKETAGAIANLMMGKENPFEVNPEEIGELELSAMQEAMNQMMGSASTSMAEIIGETVDISPPELTMDEVKDKMDTMTDDSLFVKISFAFKIGDEINTTIVQLIPIETAKAISLKLQSLFKGETEEAPSKNEIEEEGESENTGENKGSGDKTSFFGDKLNLVVTNVEICFGKKRMLVEDFLKLEQNGLMELEEEIDEPVYVYANNILVARGNLVSVDDYFGVELTQIIQEGGGELVEKNVL